jgi:metal-responsive CopG/Arc/MetJ family transcriptional regulator
MSKRVSVVLPDDVAEQLEEFAARERRSQSQMGAILIEEALHTRQALQEKEHPSPEKKGKGD